MEIVNAIRTISLGRRYISPAVAELLARQLNRKEERRRTSSCRSASSRCSSSSPRARPRAISPRRSRFRVKTVSTYRTRLMEKMNLSSNSDLTYYALKNKLID